MKDILNSIKKIEKYSGKILSWQELKKEELLMDAIVRNLQIIGEASKNIPPEIRKKHNKIEWKKMSGLRDILVHAYFGVSQEIVWDIIKNKLPELKKQVKAMLKTN